MLFGSSRGVVFTLENRIPDGLYSFFHQVSASQMMPQQLEAFPSSLHFPPSGVVVQSVLLVSTICRNDQAFFVSVCSGFFHLIFPHLHICSDPQTHSDLNCFIWMQVKLLCSFEEVAQNIKNRHVSVQ